MIPANEAVYYEAYRNIDGKEKKIPMRIFDEEELSRADAIIKNLEGLTIESAQWLLAKVNRYLLQSPVN